VALLTLTGGSQTQVVNDTPYGRSHFRFAPDGRTVAYTSGDAQSNQITVASFPAFAEKRQISVDGGYSPSWRKDAQSAA
jgi:Tol biopolymer transport system component